MGARMIKPRPEDLLERIAAALDDTVLPSVSHGPARRQLQAATAVLRRLAFALPRQAAVIADDTADLETTLRAATTLSGGMPPVLDPALSVEDRNVALQSAMADLQTRLPELNISEAACKQIAVLLDGYYQRTVERDLSLNPPGKDKSDG